jgi:hypothetical protein
MEKILLAAATGAVSAVASAATGAALSSGLLSPRSFSPPSRVAEWNELNTQLQFEELADIETRADDYHVCSQVCYRDARLCLVSLCSSSTDGRVVLGGIEHTDETVRCLKNRLLRVCGAELGFVKMSNVVLSRTERGVLIVELIEDD